MKKIFKACIVALVLCAGCNDDNNDNTVLVKPSETGTFTDADGESYKWVKYGDLYWMAENYRGGEYYNDDFEEDVTLYGNYYNFAQAKKNAPEGWRLPTDEDWQNLEQIFGMSASEAGTRDRRGGNLGEILQSEETLNLKLGGLIIAFGRPTELNLRHLRIYGYYWTATDDGTSTSTSAFFRKVSAVFPEIERNSIVENIENYEDLLPTHMNVRYVCSSRPK